MKAILITISINIAMVLSACNTGPSTKTPAEGSAQVATAEQGESGEAGTTEAVAMPEQVRQAVTIARAIATR